jgi:hypothetical protein
VPRPKKIKNIGSMSWNFGGYRAMFKSLQDAENHTDPRIRKGEVVFSDEDIQGYMGGNIAALTIDAYKRIFSRFAVV